MNKVHSKEMKKFQNESLLSQHMKMHKLMINCEICNIEFKLNYIKVHMKDYHSDERQFQCQICPQSFKYQSNFIAHVNDYKNNKFKCETCSQIFFNQTTLKRHKNEIHEKIKTLNVNFVL